MGEMKVDFGALAQASDDLRKTADNIDNELNQLESALKPLIASWEGSAQEAYGAAQMEWDKAAANMKEIAAKMGLAVKTAGEQYEQGEKKNAQSFSGG